MNKTVLFSAIALLGAAGSTAASAQEVGRVISSTPVIQQVAVQRQICNTQPIAVQQPSSGGGALLGAIVGGVLGNQIGHGMGRAVATGVGVVAGSAIGNNVENPGYQTQYAQQCSPQTSYENRTVGYNVVYEYAGRQYNAQLPQDPGPTVQVQVSPISSNQQQAPSESYNNAPSAAPGTAMGVIVGQPVAQPLMVAAPVVYPAYYPGYYYPRPYYYPPVGLSLNFGYSSGHRHWR